MVREENRRWGQAQTAYLRFLLSVIDLGLSKTLVQKLDTIPIDEEVYQFLVKQRQLMFPPKGINLL